MINDNVTEMLDLGPVPRRRGRPSTGKAMSAAEKQKLYRQRLKDRNVTKNDAETIADLRSQIELLKRQLATALESSNVTKKFVVERRFKGERKWEVLEEKTSRQEAENLMKLFQTAKSGFESEYRVTLR